MADLPRFTFDETSGAPSDATLGAPTFEQPGGLPKLNNVPSITQRPANDPAKMTRAYGAADKLGVSPVATATLPDLAQQKIDEANLADTLAKHPKTAAFFTGNERARTTTINRAADIAKVERLYNGQFEQGTAPPAGILGDVISGEDLTHLTRIAVTKAVPMAIEDAATNLWGLTRDVTDVAAKPGAVVNEAFRRFAFGDAAGDAAAQRQADYEMRRIADTKARADEQYQARAEAYAGLTQDQVAAMSGVESAAQNIPLMLGGLALRAPGLVLGGMSVVQGAASEQSARARGADMFTAMELGVADAFYEYYFEKLPVGELFKFADKGGVLQFGKLMAAEVATELPTTVMQNFNAWMLLPENKDKTASEFLAEQPAALRDTFIATVTGTILQAGAGRAVGAVANYMADQREGDQAKREADFVQRLSEAAQNLDLASADTRTITDYVNHLAQTTQGAPLAYYLNLPDFNAAVQNDADLARAFLDAIPAERGRERMGDFIASGQIELSAGDLMHAIAALPADKQKAVIERLRASPEALNVIEAQAREKEAQARVAAAGAAVAGEAEQSAKFRRSSTRVAERVREAIKATGRYSDDRARAYAALWQARIEVEAKQRGILPEEAAASLLPEIRSNLAPARPAGEALQQRVQFDLTPTGANDSRRVKSADGSTAVLYRVVDGEVIIESIRTAPGKQRKGAARAILNDLARAADAAGLPMRAEVVGQGVPTPPVERMFGGVGFQRIEGAVPEDAGGIPMRRLPQPYTPEVVSETLPQVAVAVEVAPHPNAADAVAAWGAITPEAQARVSARVIDMVAPMIGDLLDTQVGVVHHLGGYAGMVNPSYSLTLPDVAKAREFAAVAGFVLSQQSVLVTAPRGSGLNETPTITLAIPGGVGGAEARALYALLAPVGVQGFTMHEGLFVIYDFAGDTGLVDRVAAALENYDGEVTVDVGVTDADFIGDNDGQGYSESWVGSAGSDRRRALENIRDAATAARDSLVAAEAGGTLDQFAGEKAAVANLDALRQAKERADKGESREVIRQDTGWFQGLDGMWRFEISDHEAKLVAPPAPKTIEQVRAEASADITVAEDPKMPGMFRAVYREGKPEHYGRFGRTAEDALNNLLHGLAQKTLVGFDLSKAQPGTYRALGEVLDHPRLFEAYPDAAKILVWFEDGGDGGPGSGLVAHYDSSVDAIGISINLPEDKFLNYLLHEVQHALQMREGFARGGTTSKNFIDGVKDSLRIGAARAESSASFWDSLNVGRRTNYEDAANTLRYALMYQSAQNLRKYAESASPSGVLRHIRNNAQWLDDKEFANSAEARALTARWYALPKRHRAGERAAFLRAFANDAADTLLASIPDEARKAFESDTRTTRAVVAAMQREANKAYDALEPGRELWRVAQARKALRDEHQLSDPHTIYKALAGEVEARLTQLRQGMTMEERLADAPRSSDVGVSVGSVLIRFGDSTEIMLHDQSVVAGGAFYQTEADKPFYRSAVQEFLESAANEKMTLDQWVKRLSQRPKVRAGAAVERPELIHLGFIEVEKKQRTGKDGQPQVDKEGRPVMETVVSPGPVLRDLAEAHKGKAIPGSAVVEAYHAVNNLQFSVLNRGIVPERTADDIRKQIEKYIAEDTERLTEDNQEGADFRERRNARNSVYDAYPIRRVDETTADGIAIVFYEVYRRDNGEVVSTDYDTLAEAKKYVDRLAYDAEDAAAPAVLSEETLALIAQTVKRRTLRRFGPYAEAYYTGEPIEPPTIDTTKWKGYTAEGAIENSYGEQEIIWAPEVYGPRSRVNEKPYNKIEGPQHWPEYNVVGHTRWDDRTDIRSGNEFTLIGEVQADWQQEGRKLGYIGEGSSAVDVAAAEAAAVHAREEYTKAVDAELAKLSAYTETPEGAALAHEAEKADAAEGDAAEAVGRLRDDAQDGTSRLSEDEYLIALARARAEEAAAEARANTISGLFSVEKTNYARKETLALTRARAQLTAAEWRLKAARNGAAFSPTLDALIDAYVGAVIIDADEGINTKLTSAREHYKVIDDLAEMAKFREMRNVLEGDELRKAEKRHDKRLRKIADVTTAEVLKASEVYAAAHTHMLDLRRQVARGFDAANIPNKKNIVPYQPFKESEDIGLLAIKSMMHHLLTTKGQRRFALSPGWLQDMRWNAGTHFHAVRVFKNADGTYTLHGQQHAGDSFRTGEGLSNLTLSELAAGITSTEAANDVKAQFDADPSLRSIDIGSRTLLEKGDKKLSAYYDNILRKKLEQYLGAFGVKLTEIEFESLTGNTKKNPNMKVAEEFDPKKVQLFVSYDSFKPDETDFTDMMAFGRSGWQLDAAIDAAKPAGGDERSGYVRAVYAGEQVKIPAGGYHYTAYIDAVEEAVSRLRANTSKGNPNITAIAWEINDDLAAVIRDHGQALWQDESQKKLGAYDPLHNIISLLEDANASTFLHETGHAFLELSMRRAMEPDAPLQVVKDMQAFLDSIGFIGGPQQWLALSVNQRREGHEAFAEAFERYCFEGKAPSKKLQSAFDSFARWLLKVYESLTNFLRQNPRAGKLDDTLRGIMDRMLATQDEIDAVRRQRGLEPLLGGEALDVLGDELKRQYLEAQAESASDAAASVNSRKLRDMAFIRNAHSREIDRLKRRFAAERKTVREEAERTVKAEPVYAAIAYLRHGEVPFALQALGHQRLDAAAVAVLFPDGGAVSLSRGGKYAMTTNEGGVHPDLIASAFGFPSGEAMIDAILSARKMRDAIEDETDRLMFERHGDVTNPAVLAKMADEAVHNAAAARVLATEAHALDLLAKLPGAGIAETVRAATAYAKRALANVKVRDLKPLRYSAESERSERAARKAYKDAEYDKAAAAKREQLVKHELARAAYEAQEEIDKIVKYLRSFSKASIRAKMGGEDLLQLDALLARFDLRASVPLSTIDKQKEALAAYVARRSADLDAPSPDLASWVEDEGFRRHYKDLTVGQLRDLRDAVKQLEHLARRERTMYHAIRNQTFAEERDAILAAMREAHPDQFNADGTPKAIDDKHGGKVADVTSRVRDGFLADHLSIETLTKMLQGSMSQLGAIHESIFQRLSNASDDKARRLKAAVDRLAPFFDAYNLVEKAAFSWEDIGTKTVGVALTREEVVCIALLAGSESGRQRLQVFPWYAKLDSILALLDEKDTALVNAMWSMFDDYLWPDLKALNERTRGIAPEKIEPLPYTIKRADGTEFKMRGGYSPLRYNSETSQRTEQHSVEATLDDSRNVMGMSAKTRDSASKQRAEKVNGERPLLRLSVVSDVVNETVHDIAYREAVADAFRLVRDKTVRQVIIRRFGYPVYQALRNNVARVASRPVEPQTGTGWLIDLARRRVTVALLSGVKTALLNATGLVVATRYVNPARLAFNLTRSTASAGILEARKVAAMSPFMRQRFDTFDRDVGDQLAKFTVGGSILPHPAYMLAIMAYVDRLVVVPVWQTAYGEALDAAKRDGLSDEEASARAVQHADAIVRNVGGSGRDVDLTQLTGSRNPFVRAFTMFYSYFSSQVQQLIAQGVISRSQYAKNPVLAITSVAATFMCLWFLPAAATQALVEVANGAAGGEPPDEEWYRRYLRSIATYGMGFLPVTRVVGGYWYAKADPAGGRHIPREFQVSPVEAFPVGVGKGGIAVAEIAGGNGDTADLKRAIVGGSMVLGLPGKLIADTVVGTRAYLNGDAPPAAVLLGPPAGYKGAL